MSPVPSANGKQCAAASGDEEDVSPLGGVSMMSGSHYLGYLSFPKHFIITLVREDS